MSTTWLWGHGNLTAWALVALHVGLQVFFVCRALLRPHREPASRLAWVVVIIVAPIFGMVAYVFFGETNIGRRRIARFKRAMARLPSFAEMRRHEGEAEAEVAQRHLPLFRVGQSISGFPAVGGNRGRLLGDSDDVIDHIVADIDAARDHVHVCFYIWLADGNGVKVVDALRRAAERGVTCRAMADDLGSRAMVRSEHWAAMAEAGVRLAVALPIGFLLSRPLKGRIDMRNHRKIVVVDNRVTYCGSNNCADAAFAIKPRFAPWVDAMIRFEGPIVLQNQHVFATDWMAHTSEDLSPLFAEPIEEVGDGLRGPGDRHRRHGPLLGDARDVRVADVRRAARARRHHPLLRPRRADPGRALRQRPPRRRHDDRLPGAQRQLDRRRRQPQLLSAAPRRRGEDSTSTSAACCTPSR